MLEPLPYEAPVLEEVEVNGEEIVPNTSVGEDVSEVKNEENSANESEEGQTTLF